MENKLLKSMLLLIGICAISISTSSYCVPPSYLDPNAGQLVPYYENRVLVGEKCILGGQQCSCIGMVYYY